MQNNLCCSYGLNLPYYKLLQMLSYKQQQQNQYYQCFKGSRFTFSNPLQPLTHGKIPRKHSHAILLWGTSKNQIKTQNQKNPEQSLKKLLILKFSGVCSCFTNEAWYLTGILSSLGLNSNHKIKKKMWQSVWHSSNTFWYFIWIQVRQKL